MRKCEMFGCPKVGDKMHQIAPGTNVWLCRQCMKELREEKGSQLQTR